MNGWSLYYAGKQLLNINENLGGYIMDEKLKKIHLETRELEHVKRFWEESKDVELGKLFPFQDNTLEEAIELYKQSILPNAKSYGKTIYVEDEYIGDVWCYCIDENKEKNCFISIVIFNKDYWSKGIGAIALSEFNKIISYKYDINKICAFTYEFNIASRKTLEKVGFKQIEEFEENNVKSLYYELEI